MTTRKILVLFLAACLAFAGAEAALGAVPHSHGSDFDHSRHAGCAVYQMGLHGFHPEAFASLLVVLAIFVSFFAMAPRLSAPIRHPFVSSSRPPPAAL